jgi:serine/threonine protein kinase HipA of HipAB toxin-antitoxin module
MPLSDRVHVFPDLPRNTFHGLPGLLADSLPDQFGNTLIDAWLATQGRTPDRFNVGAGELSSEMEIYLRARATEFSAPTE